MMPSSFLATLLIFLPSALRDALELFCHYVACCETREGQQKNLMLLSEIVIVLQISKWKLRLLAREFHEG